jgi:hypothetical protein
MRKAKKSNFDFKDVVDLVQGFNSNILRISCIDNKDEKSKLLKALGQRMLDLGSQITKVKTEDL